MPCIEIPRLLWLNLCLILQELKGLRVVSSSGDVAVTCQKSKLCVDAEFWVNIKRREFSELKGFVKKAA